MTYIYVAYSRQNGWTEWPEIFCGHPWMAGEYNMLKKSIFFKILNLFFHFQRRALHLANHIKVGREPG